MGTVSAEVASVCEKTTVSRSEGTVRVESTAHHLLREEE